MHLADYATIKRLEDCFKLLWPRGQGLVDRYYRELFCEHEEPSALFHEDLNEQEQKLIAILAFILQSLPKPDEMAEAMRELGQRYVDYGTQVEHYPSFTTRSSLKWRRYWVTPGITN